MAESKFAGIFQNTPTPTPEPQTRQAERVEKPAPNREARPIGRPPGKRSDPAWKQFSLLLKRDTQRDALTVLRDQGGGQDLSALVESLLESWIEKQRP